MTQHLLEQIYHGDCLDVMSSLPASSVDAIVTDPPYFRAIDEPWDKNWESSRHFTDWLREVAVQWARLLVPNGSLYCFASPQMVARVELEAIEPAGFCVLNRIVWHKQSAAIWRSNRESLNQFHSGDNERLLLAVPVKEHLGAKDARNAYTNALHALAAQVFAPIREYLEQERIRSGWTNKQIDAALGTNGMAGHWFGASQWTMPNRQHYEKLRVILNEKPGDYDVLRRDYDDLRRDYDDLRRDYDDLRRPFDLGAESGLRPRGEVWRFAPAPQGVKDRHPCEKPQDLLAHIIETSTKPGALILDSFMGGGSIGVAAIKCGRRFIGIEKSDRWFDVARRSIRNATRFDQGDLFDVTEAGQ